MVTQKVVAISLACETLIALLELSSKEVNIVDKINLLEMGAQQNRASVFPEQS